MFSKIQLCLLQNTGNFLEISKELDCPLQVFEKFSNIKFYDERKQSYCSQKDRCDGQNL